MCLGIPGQLVEIVDVDSFTMKVDIGGVKRSVNVQCIVNDGQTISDCLGEWVLVHVGFAMARIDEAEARQTLRLIQELGELGELDESNQFTESNESNRFQSHSAKSEEISKQPGSTETAEVHHEIRR